MSHFGPGVIGEEAFRKEERAAKLSLNHFGPGVIGDELAKIQAEERKAEAVQDEVLTRLENVAETEPVGGPVRSVLEGAGTSLSVADMTTALALNPALFDEFFLAELNRPGGTRKAALIVLRNAEVGREEGERAAVLEQLDNQLQIHAT